jgi:hypothetical protein
MATATVRWSGPDPPRLTIGVHVADSFILSVSKRVWNSAWDGGRNVFSFRPAISKAGHCLSCRLEASEVPSGEMASESDPPAVTLQGEAVRRARLVELPEAKVLES